MRTPEELISSIQALRRKVEELERQVSTYYSYERDYITSRLHTIGWDLEAAECMLLLGSPHRAIARLSKALEAARQLERKSPRVALSSLSTIS